MSEAGIGRVIVASLHQAIGDVLPSRLDFYENWLSAEGLRGGTIGQAQLSAVLSFLRREGDAYSIIMTQAGSYAADWTVDGLRRGARSSGGIAPAWLRRRRILRLGAQLVRDGWVRSRATVRRGRGAARLVITHSVFCDVREPSPTPLCEFYAAAVTRLFERFALPAHVEIESCRGTGGSECTLTIAVSAAAEEPAPSEVRLS